MEQNGTPQFRATSCTQRHPTSLGAIWLARLRVPKKRRIFRAKNARFRCLDRLAECSFWNPSGSDRRDPNTLAPNRIKLGRLRYARQGLVRVPESNTKYGGKLGKTGAPPSRCGGQVSVSPQGFPSEKIPLFLAISTVAPLFTGEDLLWGLPLPQTDSGPIRHAVPSMVCCPGKRQGGKLILSLCLSMISAQTRTTFVARENRFPLFRIML
jgi:hypothetical protein